MKITEIRTIVVGNPWKNWLFVLVETDEGITGIGEATAGLSTAPNLAAVEENKHLVIGKDPRDIHAIWNDLYLAGFLNITSAMSGIEMACWDILGKSLGVPVHRLLGGRVRDSVRVYANGWYKGSRDPNELAEQARTVVESGYTALKFDPFGSAWRVLGRPELELAVDLVDAVREAVGTSVDILIEGHSRFSVPQAIEVAERLVPYAPTWFEEPVRHDRAGAVGEVARRSPVPIATGESFHTLGEFVSLACEGPIQYWQPEPAHIGGIGPTKSVFALAESFDSVVAPHQAGGPIATAVCLHLAACSPNHYIQEHFDAFNDPWTREIVTWSADIDAEGYLPIPTGPGLGLTLRLEEARRHPGKPEAYLPLFRDGWERREGR
jgi:galactonate dehydratase